MQYTEKKDYTNGDEAAATLNAMGPGECFSLPADISSDENCLDLAKRLGEKETVLHALWNNAGVTWGDPFEEFSESAWNKILNLNVVQIFNLTRAQPGANNDKTNVRHDEMVKEHLRVLLLSSFSDDVLSRFSLLGTTCLIFWVLVLEQNNK